MSCGTNKKNDIISSIGRGKKLGYRKLVREGGEKKGEMKRTKKVQQQILRTVVKQQNNLNVNKCRTLKAKK